MDKLRFLQATVHRKTLRLRSIEAIVLSSQFERLWMESDTELRDKVEKLVIEDCRVAILLWMKQHPSLDLGERPMDYLRGRGKFYHIKNYSRLTKPELIGEIQRRENIDEQEQNSIV